MSGGSWEYVYGKFDDVADRLKSTDATHSQAMLRRALGDHIALIANAMHAIEWVDSCDYGPGDEAGAIRACLQPTDELRANVAMLAQHLPVIRAIIDSTEILASLAVETKT